MNLNQVTVQSLDIPGSVRFYTDLGLILIVDTPHYARFECPDGDSTFSVHLADRARHSGTVVYFEVSDLRSTVTRLKSLGYQFSKEPTDESWLWFESRLADPAGNEICLYTAGDNRKNPPWRIKADPRGTEAFPVKGQ